MGLGIYEKTWYRQCANCGDVGNVDWYPNGKTSGITHLVVESDSKVLVDMLTRGGEVSELHFSLAKQIKRLLTGDWETQIVHTWREGNACADLLAAYSLQSESMDTIFLDDPPAGLLVFLLMI